LSYPLHATSYPLYLRVVPLIQGRGELTVVRFAMNPEGRFRLSTIRLEVGLD